MEKMKQEIFWIIKWFNYYKVFKIELMVSKSSKHLQKSRTIYT
jgi:hypothetical protein